MNISPLLTHMAPYLLWYLFERCPKTIGNHRQSAIVLFEARFIYEKSQSLSVQVYRQLQVGG